MSKELLLLLKKIQRSEPEPTAEPPKPSAELTHLLIRVNTRQWKEETELELEFLIEELDAELAAIEHYKTCHMCQMELQLSVERYMGSRGPWYLDLQNGDGLSDYYPDCPKVEDYTIGNYWDRTEGQAMPFIKARLKWAHKLITKQFAAACKFIKILEAWPTSRGISGQTLTQIIDEVAEIPTMFDVEEDNS